MSYDEARHRALVNEGLTDGEARYLCTDGRDDSGLNLQTDETAPISAVEEPAAPQRDHPQPDDTNIAARENELRELRERNARLDERMRVFNEAFAPTQRENTGQPDLESDPFGYMRHVAKEFSDFRNQVQERDAVTELRNSYVADAQTFVRTTPDFVPAYAFLMRSRDAELQAAGYTDANERHRIILSDERDMVARALHAQQSNASAPGPAQIIYGLAKARGFTGAAPAAQRASATQQGSFDLAHISELSDLGYSVFKRGLTPAQRKAYSAALGMSAR